MHHTIISRIDIVKLIISIMKITGVTYFYKYFHENIKTLKVESFERMLRL